MERKLILVTLVVALAPLADTGATVTVVCRCQLYLRKASSLIEKVSPVLLVFTPQTCPPALPTYQQNTQKIQFLYLSLSLYEILYIDFGPNFRLGFKDKITRRIVGEPNLGEEMKSQEIF